MGREQPHVYVASPLGFSDTTRPYYETVVLPALRHAGFLPLDPWDDSHPAVAAALAAAQEPVPAHDDRVRLLEKLDAAVGARNVELLEAADVVLALLDGTDVDSGTAAEIGFAAARGTPVVGVRSDLRQSGENDGCVVNLQVEYFITCTGGRIVRSLDEAVVALGALAPAAAGASGAGDHRRG